MTTPDTEVKPTQHIELPIEIRIPLHSLQADIGYLFGRVAADGSCSVAMAQSVRDRLKKIERACNAYEPMREALTAGLSQLKACREQLELYEQDASGETYNSPSLNTAIKVIDAALSTLPVNDRQTSDDVGILRALLEEELVWHEERDKSLSKQPPFGEKGWRRAEHQERIDVIRAALKGCVDDDPEVRGAKAECWKCGGSGKAQPASPEPEARIVTSHALPVTMWDSIATAVVKRVAELPDRSSPDNWPEAMLVTSEELHHIIMSEFDNEVG